MIDTVSVSTASIQPICGHFRGPTSWAFGTASPSLVKAATKAPTVVVLRMAPLGWRVWC